MRPICFIALQIGRKDYVLGENHRSVAKQSHRSHGVTELPQVSGPGVTEQSFHRFRMNGSDVFSLACGGSFQFCSR